MLGRGEKILSYNKVTGFSRNLPIAPTCQPTKVCSTTCYFAKGGTSWPNSLKKQHRLFNSIKDDPGTMAQRLADECGKSTLTFLRWNGGGDLFAESVQMLNRFARLKPDLPVWVTTRLPELAAQVESQANVFVHFSLDGSSLDRKTRYEALPRQSQNYFYSYQCDKGEVPSLDKLEGVSVVFFDGYKPPGDYAHLEKAVICPLNTLDDITNACEGCRRCFNDEAVCHRREKSADANLTGQ